MKTISKIAMIWSFPIFIIIVALLLIKSFFIVVFRTIFVLTGTADALAFLFARLTLFVIKSKWRDIKKNDVEFDIRN